MPDKDPNAVALGRKGGSVKSDKKAATSRENGKRGGRPKKSKDAEQERAIAPNMTK